MQQVIMTVNVFNRDFEAKGSDNLIGIHNSFGAHTRELTDEEIATLH